MTQSQRRRTGSIQTNLFGRNPDDLAAGFRRHMRQLAAELRAKIEEERRISGDEDDPVTNDPVEEATEDEDEETAKDEDEEEDDADKDEEEEEDPSYGDSGGDNEDDDSPPTFSHRSVTRSTSKKKPVSRPKWKAYRNQSRPGSSSRKRTRDR